MSSQILSRKPRIREPGVFTAKLSARSVVSASAHTAVRKLNAASVVGVGSAYTAGRSLVAESVVGARYAHTTG